MITCVVSLESDVPRRVKGILQTGQEEVDFIDLKIQELKKKSRKSHV